MPHTPAAPKPLPWYRPPAASGRSLAPDVARGLMLLLIACANSAWYLWGGSQDPMSMHPADGSSLDRGLRAVLAVAVDGRVYPLFAFLLGYGMVQFARSRAGSGHPPHAIRRLLRRRHLFLLLFGFVHALLLFNGDVLGAYGLLGLILVAPFFNRSDTTILTWGLVFGGLMALGGVLALLSQTALAGLVGDDPALARELETLDLSTGGFDFTGSSIPHYLPAMGVRAGVWLLLTPVSVFMLSLPSAILLGWWAARRGVLDNPAAHRRLLGWVAGVGIPLGWLAGVPWALQHLGLLELPAWLGWWPMSVAYPFGIFAGLGYAALFGLLASWRPRPGRVALALSALGRRSLSGYLLQSIILAPLLSAWGFGVGAAVNTAGVLAIAAGAWAVALALAVWLDALRRPGPFEALLRRLVNGGRRGGSAGSAAAAPDAASAGPGRE